MADKLGDGTCTAVDPEDDTLGYTLVTCTATEMTYGSYSDDACTEVVAEGEPVVLDECSGADGFYYKLGAPAAAGGDSTMMIVIIVVAVLVAGVAIWWCKFKKSEGTD